MLFTGVLEAFKLLKADCKTHLLEEVPISALHLTSGDREQQNGCSRRMSENGNLRDLNLKNNKNRRRQKCFFLPSRKLSNY